MLVSGIGVKIQPKPSCKLYFYVLCSPFANVQNVLTFVRFYKIVFRAMPTYAQTWKTEKCHKGLMVKNFENMKQESMDLTTLQYTAEGTRVLFQ